MKSRGTIKNRSAAPIQVTAEQLLREAKERGLDDAPPVPTQFITDKEELSQFQQSKRKDFEDQIRRQRQHIGTWCRYGLWEASQKEFERARSVFERALDVDYRQPTLWLKYADMEMKAKFVNHARNVWDRAVTLHPRLDTFWFKYTYMEELVGAVDNARQVFERWMQWEPDDTAWFSFIKFEMRQSQLERARALYERYIAQLPTARAYLKYARWEEQNHQKALSRKLYERSLVELHPFERTEKLLTNFARFEERCKEFERARVVYQYAISQASTLSTEEKGNEEVTELKKEFIAFEKRHGNKALIEDALVQQRREVYEDKLQANRYDYDTWFDYIQLEEAEGVGNGVMNDNTERVRAVYARAKACVPLLKEKKYWRRYIFLWINHAIYEELAEKDLDGAAAVYQECLDKVVPHADFTFGKIWMMAAHLEVRRKDLTAARKLLGTAIGMTKKTNVFKGYIELEQQMGEVDRCRNIYTKFVEASPYSFAAWNAFAQLEISVGEVARARAIFEVAVQVEDMDSPEMVWKNYIDFEMQEGEGVNVRELYVRLLAKTSHVKVWISYATFEADNAVAAPKESDGDDGQTTVVVDVERRREGFAASREVYQKGYTAMKEGGFKEERLMLLEAWRDMERVAVHSGSDCGSVEQIASVEEKFPKKIKMKRDPSVPGNEHLSEFFFDYVFPDDEQKIVGMKILEKAMQWKKIAEAFGGGQ